MSVNLNHTNSGNITLNSPVSGNIELTLPATAGSVGQALVTDGAGNLSFATPTAPTGIADTAPSNPVSGTMWWDSATGSLRIYYVDGDSSQWVDAINVDGTQSLNTSTASASVDVSDLPPSNPVAGDLWWNSIIGSLQVYYVDGDSSQWVDVVNVESTSGPAGETGAGVPLGGTTGQVLVKSSATDYATQWDMPGKYTVISTEYTTGTGTFTPDPAAKFFQVICTGAGGGGGGADSDGSAGAAAGGGGSGGTIICWYSTEQLGASATYVIGAAGAQGDISGGTGGTGGSSSFTPIGTGTPISGTGGAGGTGTGVAFAAILGAFRGGAGGSSSGGGNGSLSINGTFGGAGFSDSFLSVTGSGANSFHGSGGESRVYSAAVNIGGAAGLRPGSGGSGALANTSIAGTTGGGGTNGSIIVITYI